MPAIQSLKKQLKGVLSTKKLTKAMKTVSTVKFSKLNAAYNEYSAYGRQCKKVFSSFGKELIEAVAESNPLASEAVIVIASNKGLCGNFNAELFEFALEQLKNFKNPHIIACGKKTVGFLKSKNIALKKEVILSDVPDYNQVAELFDEIVALRKSGEVSKVYIIYPAYKNMMQQIPTCTDFFDVKHKKSENTAVFIPEKQTINNIVSKTVFKAMFYEIVLEAAIGAQAATLMTMRSAYDTATEYAENLDKEINRLRQSAVTADVIETSAERETK